MIIVEFDLIVKNPDGSCAYARSFPNESMAKDAKKKLQIQESQTVEIVKKTIDA